MQEEKPTSHHESAWQADLMSLVFLVVFVLIVYNIEAWVKPVFTPTTLTLTGVVLSIIPAVLWLGFFYRRDRLEPEPKSMVIQVFFLGGLLAAAIGIPLVENIFQVSEWMYANVWTRLLGGILVVGFTQEFLKYAAVRWTVYKTDEFDEPVDGIIYATAAGLGYAAMLNILFVVQSGGVDLGAGVIRITIISMAHASFAGVVGYFLGIEKFQNKPVWFTSLGVVIAAVLNGVFFTLRGSVIASGMAQANVWLGFVLAAILAGATTYFLSGAIQRQLSAGGAK
ncbi:MAG: PrsW family intramembrane metalloprotease [Anaerolineales bacterium]|nr:PrsW family intramembrane metalloprotease [Anaerolineales bacterium]